MDCRSPPRAANRYSGNSPTRSSCRCRRSRRRRRRASGWCKDRASKAISRISMRSMNGGRAPGSRRREIGDMGAIELVEIPSGRESNDNIVVFFRPAQPLSPQHPAKFAYSITWTRRTGPAQGHWPSGRNPFRRQHRPQTARVPAGFRRCRREARRIAARSVRLRRQNIQCHPRLQRRIAWLARQLRDRSERCRAD